MTFVPSTAQQNYFDWINQGRGNCVLEAVAGAGKTTTIVQGIRYMQGRVFLGAYNKKMADELKERVASKTNVKASTFHAAGYSALLFAFSKQKALKVEANKVRDIVDSLIVVEGEDKVKPYIGTVCKMVSMAKNRGIGALHDMEDSLLWDQMVDHYDLDADLPEGCLTSKAIEYSKRVLHRSNADLEKIDFDDMVYLPIVYNLKMFQSDWVLIDEAQDTNATRRELARRMVKPGYGRLVAVGDPSQAIFGFTGADNDALQQITDEFKCKTLPLSVSYRCPKAVVKHARNWVSHIEAHPDAPEGKVSTMEYKDVLPILTPGDAVLCRYNKYLVALCFKLIRKGIPAKIEGRSIGEGLMAFCDKWRTSSTEQLRQKLEKYMGREVKKALDKKQEDRADRIIDQVETMYVLIDRGLEQGIRDTRALKDMIRGMFADDVSTKKVVILSSVHRSKGLEWNRVYLLGRAELMPSRMAKQPWNISQEINLIYVAVTRAKEHLIEVTGIKAILEDKKS